MTTAVAPDICPQPARSPLRVLVSVHGHESPRWTAETCRLVSTWTDARVRVLGLLDVPRPSFTSLSGFGRGAYARARVRWGELERGRIQPVLGTLRAGLSGDVEVASVEVPHADLARAVVEEARAWSADVVVVGPPSRPERSRLRTGPVHERLVRLAPCTVVVIAEPSEAPSRAPRQVALAQAAAGEI